MPSAPPDGTDGPDPADPRLGAVAHVLAWCALAIINAGFIATSRPGPSRKVRLLHHLFDAGQLVLAGFVVYAAVFAWRRWGPRRYGVPIGLALGSTLAMALGLHVLPLDLVGLVSSASSADAADWLVWPASAAAALALPAAAITGAWAGRRSLVRWAAVTVGLAAAAGNNLVLKGDYGGLHVVAGFAAALLVGSALSHARAPRWTALHPRAGLAARVIAFVPALLAIVVPPSQVVRVEMFKIDGAIIVPLLVWQEMGPGPAVIAPSAWFRRRDKTPDIVPPGPPFLGGNPIVLLVTMDSVRAELLTDPRYADEVARLRALQAESVSFTEARSCGAGTVVTFASVFTGKHHFQLRWRHLEKRALPDHDDSLRFTELLQNAGIETVTFASFPPLAAEVGLLRGFDESTLVPKSSGQDFALADPMVDAAIARLSEHDGGPMFLFMHLMDPHSPYDAAKKHGPVFDRYVAEVGMCSRAMGRLVDALKDLGLWERTILIVGADHGEGFNKHGVQFHNIGLYEEILRVPLFIRVPGAAPRSIAEPVSMIDLGPTILHLFGLPTPGTHMGQSLVPFLEGKDPELTRPIVASTLFRSNAFYSFPLKVIHDFGRKSVQVYDLSVDPDERENLADTPRGVEVDALLRSFMRTHGLKRQ